jgi:hypothetical protein
VSRPLIWFTAAGAGLAGSARGGGGGANSRFAGCAATAGALALSAPTERASELDSAGFAFSALATPPPFVSPPTAPKPSDIARRRFAVVGVAIDRAGG